MPGLSFIIAILEEDPANCNTEEQGIRDQAIESVFFKSILSIYLLSLLLDHFQDYLQVFSQD